MAPLTFGAGWPFVVGGCLSSQDFCSMPGSPAREARNTPSCDNPKCLSTWPRGPQGQQCPRRRAPHGSQVLTLQQSLQPGRPPGWCPDHRDPVGTGRRSSSLYRGLSKVVAEGRLRGGWGGIAGSPHAQRAPHPWWLVLLNSGSHRCVPRVTSGQTQVWMPPRRSGQLAGAVPGGWNTPSPCAGPSRWAA